MDYIARTPDQLGPLLRSWRKQRRLTQEATGAMVGLKQATVSAVEADPARTSIATLYKLLSALSLELVIRDKRTASTHKQREW
jgi:HTH-type transcriptional regulator/antitoxin HipB